MLRTARNTETALGTEQQSGSGIIECSEEGDCRGKQQKIGEQQAEENQTIREQGTGKDLNSVRSREKARIQTANRK